MGFSRRFGHDRIKDYEIYITDSEPDNRIDWGAPAASGRWADNSDLKEADLSRGIGRYAIIYGVTGWQGIGVRQVWFYGIRLDGLPPQLDGNVNGDCVVNILDLIGVRNHLNQDPTRPPENQPYNVNGDDAINILDMIYVRNRLNTMCPE